MIIDDNGNIDVLSLMLLMTVVLRYCWSCVYLYQYYFIAVVVANQCVKCLPY